MLVGPGAHKPVIRLCLLIFVSFVVTICHQHVRDRKTFDDVDRVWSGDRCARWSASGWRGFCVCHGQVSRYHAATYNARLACENWPPRVRLLWASYPTSRTSTTPFRSTTTGARRLTYIFPQLYPHLSRWVITFACKLQCGAKKTAPLYFCNNFVKTFCSEIIIGPYILQ